MLLSVGPESIIIVFVFHLRPDQIGIQTCCHTVVVIVVSHVLIVPPKVAGQKAGLFFSLLLQH